jgi:hypothetical protein
MQSIKVFAQMSEINEVDGAPEASEMVALVHTNSHRIVRYLEKVEGKVPT